MTQGPRRRVLQYIRCCRDELAPHIRRCATPLGRQREDEGDNVADNLTDLSHHFAVDRTPRCRLHLPVVSRVGWHSAGYVAPTRRDNNGYTATRAGAALAS